MADYGNEFEETHESMHIHRRERHYNGHKLAVAVGHNKAMRASGGGESTKRKNKKV
jgi:hypothetical protein